MANAGGVEVRPIRPDEYVAWRSHTSRAFGGTPDVARFERERERIQLPDTLGAFHGDEVIGTAHHEPSRITLPGGARLDCAGVTRVSVAPTHRRRGILRAMMSQQLARIASQGTPLAALWASESSIYGRFGYGLATVHEHWRIEREYSAAGWWATEPKGGVRFIPTATARPVIEPLFEQFAAMRPGGMTRLGHRWDSRLADLEHDRGGMSPLHTVVHETSGVTDGYVTYRVRWAWPDNLPAFDLRVQELVGLTVDAELGLWQFLFGVDLVHNIEVEYQALDSVLPWTLADFRRLQRRTEDGIWLRVLDIPAAFAARSYMGEGRLVIAVDDPILPDAGGRFLIEATGRGAQVTRTEDPPDLTALPAAMGTLLLGTQRASILGQAGLIEESRPGALALADELFRWPTAPQCLYHF